MFDITRRINRPTFWLGWCSVFLAYVSLIVVINLLPLKEDGSFEPIYGIPLLGVFLLNFWYGIVLAKQRANDVSGQKSFLLFFVSLFLVGILVGLMPSEKAKNKYGLKPSGIQLFG